MWNLNFLEWTWEGSMTYSWSPAKHWKVHTTNCFVRDFFLTVTLKEYWSGCLPIKKSENSIIKLLELYFKALWSGVESKKINMCQVIQYISQSFMYRGCLKIKISDSFGIVMEKKCCLISNITCQFHIRLWIFCSISSPKHSNKQLKNFVFWGMASWSC